MDAEIIAKICENLRYLRISLIAADNVCVHTGKIFPLPCQPLFSASAGHNTDNGRRDTES